MDTILLAVLAAAIAGAATGIAGFYLRGVLTARATTTSLEAAEQQIRRAEARSKEILLEAKEEALRTKTSSEGDLRRQRQELQKLESRVEAREGSLDRRSESLNKQESEVKGAQGRLDGDREELKALRQQELARLEKVSGLSLADARQILLDRAQEEVQFDLAKRFRDAEAQARAQAEERAREIISGAIQRLASGVVSESTVSTIPLPNEEMKGRLIGREGRNIRAIEAATGVDLIIDDVPEAVTISCFDPIRRQVAKLAIERLIQDGRIHPTRVEEAVEKAQHEVDETVRKAGQQALFDTNIKVLHPELLKLMGRLKYRTSYGENVLKHCVEVSLLAGMMAAELGANVQNCKLAGFLHDVGKAMTHEVEGPHAEIGADIVAKYGVGPEIQTPIREHHDREMTTVASFIVAAADAISAARPGARQDTVENYVQRLEALEEVARGFEGVEKVYAIQAGREVRVLVKPDTVDDAKASVLARDIVKRIEETLSYPGQIKVVVVRESRVVEYAR
ncbi:MAG: ribonuclease Y [Dehalococcoidia bacterium]|nr:ribonuclease Y [Dehalococcoidia bacterium]MSQ34260.1 ribonuclease Y [Dehalococcoidia bacterium]